MANEHLVIAHYLSEHLELTYEQIATQLGVSKATLIRVARDAGIRRTRGRKLKLKLAS
jgi:DNA-binding MurR/RpiR family transcriptional regulator